MLKSRKLPALAILAAGTLLGYLAASSNMRLDQPAIASPTNLKVAANSPLTTSASATAPRSSESGSSTTVCMREDAKASLLLAQANTKQPEVLLAQADNAADQKSSATSGKKPNILFIMGDDIGWMQPGCYHRGLMVGETPNIDRIANEGAIFMDYVAMQSCTSGRNAFVTGMYPLRTGMIPPQLPGSPSYLRPGTPCIAKFLLDLGYTTGQFGKNHLGDHPDSLPTAHGFQEYWGYLYHLDAMQQVSFPDINKTPLVQGIAPPMKVVPIPGIPEPPGAIDSQRRRLPGSSAPDALDEVPRRHGEEPDGQGRGAADAGAVENGGRGNLLPRH